MAAVQQFDRQKKLMNSNRKDFLDMIAWSELGERLLRNSNKYAVIQVQINEAPSIAELSAIVKVL